MVRLNATERAAEARRSLRQKIEVLEARINDLERTWLELAPLLREEKVADRKS